MVPTRDLLDLLQETCCRLSDPGSLDALARRAGWSKFYLHRSFRTLVGETPKQYTQRLRLERAAASLACSGDSVLRIALNSGYNSHEVFTRAFRRQFGCTPVEYRARALQGVSPSDRERHHDLVSSVGPCIGLFRISLNQATKAIPMTEPSIERRELAEQPILFIQRKVAQSELQTTFAECFGKLYGHGMQAGLAIAGQPITRYVSLGPGRWTIDCAIPLHQPAEGEGEMKPGTLPAGPAVVAIHMGPYDQLHETHAAIEKWVEANGLEANGPPWEQYVTDPTQAPDPSQWQTDVYWPVAS